MNFKVGDKVRIVKCVVFFSPKIFLGKVDTIVHVDDYIELEKYKLDNEKDIKLKELDNEIKLKEIEVKMKLFDNIDKLTPEILKYLMH